MCVIYKQVCIYWKYVLSIMDKNVDPKRLEMTLPVRVAYQYLLWAISSPALCRIGTGSPQLIEQPLSGTSPGAVAEGGEMQVNHVLIRLCLG